MLAVGLVQGTGLGVSVAELACDDAHHATEGGPADSNGDCPPECATCPCCVPFTWPPPMDRAALAAPVVQGPVHRGCAAELPSDPGPRGILHVPRLAA